LKLAEAKFCVEPECEEVLPLKESQCCCGCTQFILLATLTNPETRDWVKRRLHRERAKLRLMRMVKG